MVGEENYKSAYQILKQPLSEIRVEVADKFISQKLNLEDFKTLSRKLLSKAHELDNISLNELSEEINNAYHFLKTGVAKDRPNISDSAMQFVWGLALACTESDKSIRGSWTSDQRTKPIYKLQVWEDIKNSHTARAELRRHAFMVTKLPTMQEDTLLKWGACKYPNIGFYFNKQKNLINLDLLWALIGGFEHTRAAQLHEIGHSQGTLVYSPKLRELQKQYDEINEKVRGRTCSKEEYKQLRRIEKEYKLRFALFDEAENSYANRFAVNASEFGMVRQDISYDLNAVETQLLMTGKYIMNNSEKTEFPKDNLANRFYNLERAVRMAFFVNNEIVEDEPEEWQKLGVNVDWLEYHGPNGENLTGQKALVKLQGMTKRLEELQLKERDYHKTDEEIYDISLEYSKKRGEIMDEIFDAFAKQYYDRIIQNEEKKQQEEEEKKRQEEEQNRLEEENQLPQQEQQQQSKDGGNSEGGNSEDSAENGDIPTPDMEDEEQEQTSGGNGAANEDDIQTPDTEGEEQEQTSGGGGAENEDDTPTPDTEGEEQEQTSGGGGETNEDDIPTPDTEGEKQEQEQASGGGGAANEDDIQTPDTESEEQEQTSGGGGAANEDDTPTPDTEGEEQEQTSGGGGKTNEDDIPTPDTESEEQEQTSGGGGAANEDDIPTPDTEGEEQEQTSGGGGAANEDDIPTPDMEGEEQEQTSGGDGEENENDTLIPDENGDKEMDALSEGDEENETDSEVLQELFGEDAEDTDSMKALDDLAENPEEEYQNRIMQLLPSSEEDDYNDDDARDVMEIIRTPLEEENKNKRNADIKRELLNDSKKAQNEFKMPKTLMPESEYQKIIVKHYDLIEELKRKFVLLQNKYYDDSEAEVRSIVPEAGNIKVDIPSYIERLKKQLKGEELKEKDFENFIVQGEVRSETKAPIDIAILIDNSGSMSSAGTDELAIEIGCALFQATRDNPAFNVYVALMHNPTTWIAKPGENSLEVSKRLATVHKMGIGDDVIADNIVEVLQEVEKRKASNKSEGSINFFMITDGCHTDSGDSFPLVEKAVNSDLPLTFNWILTESVEHSWVGRMIKEHSAGIGTKHIEYADNVEHDNMLDKIMSIVEKRVDETKLINAVDTPQKKMNISFFLEKLEKEL